MSPPYRRGLKVRERAQASGQTPTPGGHVQENTVHDVIGTGAGSGTLHKGMSVVGSRLREPT
jgi:hypothetical protein